MACPFIEFENWKSTIFAGDFPFESNYLGFFSRQIAGILQGYPYAPYDQDLLFVCLLMSSVSMVSFFFVYQPGYKGHLLFKKEIMFTNKPRLFPIT